MSHWNNFPACSFMTDFEIVVVQNERARLERERLEQEQLNAQPYNQLQDHHGIEQQQQQINDNTDNPLLVNMLSNLGPEPLPDPLTPIHTAPPAYTLIQATPPQPQVELSQVENSTREISTITTDVSLTTNANQPQPQTVSNSTTLNQSLGNDSSSSGTYQSFTDEFQENNSLADQIPFRNNDTVFMTYINELNVKRNIRTILISAVRPSFQCQAHNEFFICHVCQNHPRKMKLSDQLWERGDDDHGNELPFAYNLRGIIDHLTKFHCETHIDEEGNKSRDMIRTVSNFIAMINKDIDQNISKMFCFEDSIPKASSTSCLNSTWKSNQTDLTLHLSQAYDFQHYTNGCNGHLKWKAVEGKAYELDLADTVYCSCNAATVKPKIHADLPLPEVILNSCGNLTLGTRDHPEHPMAEVILDPTLTRHSSIWRKKQYFNRTKQSFAIIKYSNLYLNSPKEPLFQKNPLPEEIQRLKEILRTIKKHRLKINPQAAAKSSPEQQSSANLKLASCPIPPPGQVRLPPEGESPPVPHSRPDWSKM